MNWNQRRCLWKTTEICKYVHVLTGSSCQTLLSRSLSLSASFPNSISNLSRVAKELTQSEHKGGGGVKIEAIIYSSIETSEDFEAARAAVKRGKEGGGERQTDGGVKCNRRKSDTPRFDITSL